jgi:hypothetical protein
MSEKAFQPTASENHLIADVERAAKIREWSPRSVWDGQQNSSGNKIHSNPAEKNNRPAPERANDHIHVAASQNTLTLRAPLRALKTDAGGSSQCNVYPTRLQVCIR